MTKFNTLEFIANNAGLSMVEAIEKAYSYGLEQQSSEDCISREAVFEQISCWVNSGEYRYTNATYYLTRWIQGISPVTSKPKTGRWILEEVKDEYGRPYDIKYFCSECQAERPPIWDDYCSACGAKMLQADSEEQESEE